MQTEQATPPQLQGLSGAAVSELRELVRVALSERFGQFLKVLPAALKEKTAHTASLIEQRTYKDMARRLGMDPQPWLDTFLRHVDGQMVGGISARETAEDSGATDGETIALASLELNAEAHYQKLIMELDARLNRVRLTLYVPLYTRALAPAGLCRSLHDTASELGWPATHRWVLFEQFDAQVIAGLGLMYRALLDAIKRIGMAVEKAAETGAPAVPAVAAASAPPTHPPSGVDTQTASMLRACAMQADGEGYTDALLAADLLALMDRRPLPGLAENQSWIPLQRITLAGMFLNRTINDPLVPSDLKPQHEAVRLPLVKSALTDPSLFTDLAHPLRSLVNELMLKAATSRITDSAEGRRSVELLQELLVNFNLAPDFVREALADAKPIPDSQIERFFEMQRQQAEQRRDFVISEAKRIVSREMERVTFGRAIPASAFKFLNRAWGPLLTKRLLQHGAAHALWKNSLVLFEQLIDQLEARQPQEAASTEWRELSRALANALSAEGLAGAALSEALTTLESARQEPLTQ